MAPVEAGPLPRPPVAEAPNMAPPPPRQDGAAFAAGDASRPERIGFGSSSLRLPPARGNGAPLPVQGTLTFSANRLGPGELLRIVAGALNLTPVVIDPPPEKPQVEVPPSMSVEAALALLDNVLAAAGQELSFDGNVVYVRNSSGVGDVRLSRHLVRAIRLNFIDNQTFANLASSLVPKDRLVLPAGDPSLVIYVGPASGSGSIEALRPLVDTFDLKDTQAVLLPLHRRKAADVAHQVQDAVGNGAMPRIIALPQRQAVMVVAPRSFDTANVAQLVQSIDAGTPEENSPLHTYTPLHRTAVDLLAVLHGMGGAPSAAASAPGTALPGERPVGGAPAPGLFSAAAPGASSAAAPGLSSGVAPAPGSPAAGIFNGPLTGAAPGGAGPAPGLSGSGEAPSVIQSLLAQTNVDRQTNRIVFSGSPADFATLRRALRTLDQGGGQILVEAMIMQVALNDQLQYGVQYALNNARIFSMPISASDATGLPSTAGLVLSLGRSSAQVIVSALDQVTNVSVISSPKILTVSGDTAKFHFGASVPVLQSTLTTSQGLGAALANQVDYRDTGVSLSVTPSAIDNTTADLSISQSLSDVSSSTVKGVDSPVFDDRQIDTHVRLRFGDTILLGGIIEHDRNDTDTGIPFLRRLDLLGPLFGTTARGGARSEYVLLLTPRLYTDGSRGPRLSDALSLRFERLQKIWDDLHYVEAFPTASVDRVRQLRGP